MTPSNSKSKASCGFQESGASGVSYFAAYQQNFVTSMSFPGYQNTYGLQNTGGLQTIYTYNTTTTP